MRKHLKWARIQVANYGRQVSKEVAIVKNGIKYLIPIWVESKVRMEAVPESHSDQAREDGAGTNPVQAFCRWINLVSHCAQVHKSLLSKDTTFFEHVEVTDRGVSTVGEAREKHGPILNEGIRTNWAYNSMDEHLVIKDIGPDFATQVIFNNLKGETEKAQEGEWNYDISKEVS